jgi:hypothetical protein
MRAISNRQPVWSIPKPHCPNLEGTVDSAMEGASLLYKANVWEWAAPGARAGPPGLDDASRCFLSKGRKGAQP